MSERNTPTPVAKSVRFEVFKRDKFTCQYCGRSAPEVVLHCDHIKPSSLGGASDILNLVTACAGCNLGKSDKALDDASAIKKQQHQLGELQERREQLEMLMAWREGLENLEEDGIDAVANAFCKQAHAKIKPSGYLSIRKWIKSYGLPAVLEAVDASTAQYLVWDGESYTSESIDKAFKYVQRICSFQKRYGDKADLMRQIYYLRGVARKNCLDHGSYFNDSAGLDIIKRAVESGVDMEELKSVAYQTQSWTWFYGMMDRLGQGIRFKRGKL